jgi:hypothetical protein
LASSGIRKRAVFAAGILTGFFFTFLSPNPGFAQEAETDPWGAKRSFGLAAADVVMANLVPWAFNEFPRGSSISQMNPASWWHNFQEGMGYDDNFFSTNQFAHPYQGSLYFNAARSNGFSFWESAPFAFAGSLMWECCGETHLMSVNDFVNTGLGGIALGEMLYRTSSLVLDNTATEGRGKREAWGFLLNPVRSFNRLITGRATKVTDNPSDPLDKAPEFLVNRLHMGVRGFAENSGFTDPQYGGFLNLDFQFGAPFGIERNKPFEFFLLSAQVNFSDKKALGKLTVHANLYYRDLGGSDRNQHRFMVLQHFDYVNNNAYESGGQSLGAGILSRWELGEPGDWSLFTVAEGTVAPMAAVNSDFAFLAEVPGTRENYRSYDFGVGGGGRFGVAFIKGQNRIVDLVYGASYLNTLNGSVTNGSDAWHILQSGVVRALIPVSDSWSLGADYEIFLRNSYYTAEELDDHIRQRSPQLRTFLSWKLGQSGAAGVGG